MVTWHTVVVHCKIPSPLLGANVYENLPNWISGYFGGVPRDPITLSDGGIQSPPKRKGDVRCHYLSQDVIGSLGGKCQNVHQVR